MGGHCLPVDPFYLAFKAREHDFYTEFIELAGKLNQAQPQFLRGEDRAHAERREEAGPRLACPAARVAYKAGIGDLREARASRSSGASAPLARRSPTTTPTFRTCRVLACRSAELDPELARADIVAIVTAHPEVDYERVVREAALVLDFRGVTRGIRGENLVRL